MARGLGCARGREDDVDPQPGPGEDLEPAPGRGFKCDPKSYYPSACVLEDGSIFMVGQREGFKNRFGPHGAEVTSVRFRIKKPGEGEGVELLPIGGPS